MTLIFFDINGQEIGVWKNYTDMRIIKKASSRDNIIWAATEGGAFSYDFESGTYNRFTKSEKLKSQTLTSLAIDAQGKIWFGSAEGYIDVYDPVAEKISTIRDIFTSDKSRKGINDIFISGDTVFVATDFGLSLIKSTTLSFLETISKFDTLPAETKVNSVNKGALIYVSTDRGLAIQKKGTRNLSAPESWSIIRTEQLGNASRINNMVVFEEQYYVGTDIGIFRSSDSIWSQILYAGFEVYDMKIVGDKLYSVLFNTLHEFKDNKTQVVFRKDGLKFNDLYVDPQNRFFLSTSGGILNIFTPDTLTIAPSGPRTNSFSSIDVDSDGNLWAGSGKSSTGGGIYKFDGETWTNFNSTNVPEIIIDAFHVVYAAPDNNIYFSNWGRGYSVFSDSQFETFTADNTDLVGVPEDTKFLVIGGIKYDDQNNIWILNYEASNNKLLSVLTADGNFKQFEFGSPLSPRLVAAEHLLVDQYNTKWFAVTGDNDRGLYYFNENNTLDNLADDSWGVIKTSDGLRSNDITALALDERGEIWVGTTSGVNVITDPSRPYSSIFSPAFAIRQQTITSIEVDPLNQKWVGTRQGVFLMSSDGTVLIQQFDSRNSPLPTDDINCITIDENSGILFIGSDFGISSLSTPSIKPQESFDKLFIYPNPLIISGNSSPEIKIDGLIKDAEIKILSIDGKLVNEFRSPGGKIAFWDGRDMSGNSVSSGIYLIVAYDREANNISTAKLAVLRN